MKSKLRHAEYYDFQGIADSQKGRVFKHLTEMTALPENIRLAYRNIKANHGSKTAGTDGRTIKDLENLPDEKLVALVYKNIQLSHYYYVVDIDIKGFFDNVNHSKLLKQMWAMGIRDKKLLSIISAMLKAEVAGMGFPEKGTPQGGL